MKKGPLGIGGMLADSGTVRGGGMVISSATAGGTGKVLFVPESRGGIGEWEMVVMGKAGAGGATAARAFVSGVGVAGSLVALGGGDEIGVGGAGALERVVAVPRMGEMGTAGAAGGDGIVGYGSFVVDRVKEGSDFVELVNGVPVGMGSGAGVVGEVIVPGKWEMEGLGFGSAVVVTPEPGAGLVMGIGVVVVLARRRR